MSKTLVIAEKPSVASDLARALGGFKKEGDHFENDRYIIASAIGHLVELALTSELDVKRGKWSFANLPIIPDEFELKPIEKTKARFNTLKRLIQRKDVDLLINACDAGREGELIFRYLVKLSGSKKPIQRLWLQSMTSESIRSAFQHLRSNEEMIPLAKAAVCRSESDWLVGINGTRAMTAFNNKTGGFQLTPVGRVQTPTLAILTEREQKIHDFKTRTFFEVFADFEVKAGAYRGRWFREGFAKDGDEEARAERIWDKTSKRIFNNAKISDHFAIVPSGQAPHGLDEAQQKIYDMITRRFIAVFFPVAQFEVTTRITRVEKDAFKSEGKIMKEPGWLEVYGREAPTDDQGGQSLVAISENEQAKVLDIDVTQSETKRPPRFNEATLLSAMEGAGKLVEDEELRDAMREKGLGTPATRAAIIEGLISQGYVIRQGRDLIATAKIGRAHV